MGSQSGNYVRYQVIEFKKVNEFFSINTHERGIKMILFKDREEYTCYFQEILKDSQESVEELESYLEKQLRKLDQLVQAISPETFWEILPMILGIDAKLILLTELIKFENFSQIDIIRLVESDYLTYFKELCGYDLSMKTGHSMIFNIA